MAASIPKRLLEKVPKEDLNRLAVRKYEGEVRLVSGNGEMAGAIEEMARERVLGFDTETRPSFKKGQSFPPALIQLAGASTVWLFHLSRIDDPTPLNRIFGDPAIAKVGVALDQDLKQLGAEFPLEAAGFTDLGNVARKAGIASHGLRTMAASFFGFRISKRARCSNWGKARLEPYQISYAATDAWVSREIFLFLEKLGLFEGAQTSD